MSVQLLDKTRKINKLLHNNHSTKVVFNDICEVLMETLSSNILVISKKGKVLGISLCPGVEEITELIEDKVGGYVDAALNERLLGVLSTKENVNLQTLGFERPGVECYTAIICPIEIAGERLGTVFMYRCTPQYDIDDIIVSEYGTSVVGLEMMRSVNEENVEENRKVQVVKSAFNTLSFSELEAIIDIFDDLNVYEGIRVASKIADRFGISRSVISKENKFFRRDYAIIISISRLPFTNKYSYSTSILRNKKTSSAIMITGPIIPKGIINISTTDRTVSMISIALISGVEDAFCLFTSCSV